MQKDLQLSMMANLNTLKAQVCLIFFLVLNF